jgi:hypothetical protein
MGGMETPRLRSPLARAVVPVLGGIVFFVLFFLGLWFVASTITDRADSGDAIANKVFKVGKVDVLAKAVADGGPLLFPDLKSPDGVRSIVLDHSGNDPAVGWRVYYGYPADRDATCLVTHEEGSREFTDCAGRTLTVDDLTLPQSVRPIVENRKTLYVDLSGVTTPVVP